MRKYAFYLLWACLIIGFSFLTTEQAFSQSNQTSPVKGITPGRARALVGVATGLISVVIGWRAKLRSAKGVGNRGRNGAVVALCLGAVTIILSINHLSGSAGAVFGSGSGKAGVIFALVLSLVGLTLSGLVLRQKKI